MNMSKHCVMPCLVLVLVGFESSYKDKTLSAYGHGKG